MTAAVKVLMLSPNREDWLTFVLWNIWMVSLYLLLLVKRSSRDWFSPGDVTICE